MLKSWPYSQRTMFSVATALALILFPKSITAILVRVAKKPLVIHTAQREPPKEAFEDLYKESDKTDEWIDLKQEATTNLNMTTNQRKKWNPLTEIGQRKMVLPPLMIVHNTVEKDFDDRTWINELTPDLRARIDDADQRHQILGQNWTPPNWRSFAEQKIAQIKQQTQPQNPGVRIGQPGSSDERKLAQLHNTGVEVANIKLPTTILSGKVRLAPGLALGARRLDVRHTVDGVPMNDTGRADPQTGTFTIDLANTQGSVSIDLIEDNGTILASGSHRLSGQESGAPLEIYVAAKSRLAGNITNFNKNPERLISAPKTSSRGQPAEILYASIGVSDQTDALGSFSFPKISESSWGLVRAKALGFSEALFLIGAGEQQNLPMMPSSLISALKDLTQVASTEDGGIIWGQILFDGKPLSGITVSLEQDEDTKAVYLAGFIPNQSLPGTTENGYFIFPQLPRGMHSLIATRNGEYFGHINIVVDDGAVSVGVIEATTSSQPVTVKVYDAFDGTAEGGQVQLQSLKESITVRGQIQINLQNVHRLSLGNIFPDSNEYMPAQLVYSDTDEYIHVPMIKAAWLQWLMGEQRITATPGSGFVVGFVPEDDFEAYLPQETDYDTTNVVYFDYKGQIVPSGVSGGGFVMFNVPSGTQSVVVMSKKTEMLASQVFPVDPNSTSIIKFRF